MLGPCWAACWPNAISGAAMAMGGHDDPLGRDGPSGGQGDPCGSMYEAMMAAGRDLEGHDSNDLEGHDSDDDDLQSVDLQSVAGDREEVKTELAGSSDVLELAAQQRLSCGSDVLEVAAQQRLPSAAREQDVRTPKPTPPPSDIPVLEEVVRGACGRLAIPESWTMGQAESVNGPLPSTGEMGHQGSPTKDSRGGAGGDAKGLAAKNMQAASASSRRSHTVSRLTRADFEQEFITKFKGSSRAVLGEGSEGRVVAAQSRTTGELHAVKWCSKVFQREVEILDRVSRTRHPNIARPEFLIMDGSRTIGMMYTYYPDDLAKYRDRARNLLPKSLISLIAHGVLSGLVVLHSLNLVHRDIKPQNLLIGWPSPCFNIAIADWGWCREESKKDMTPSCVTISYRAPEIELGEPSYGRAIDLWAFGIVVLELLSGVLFAPQAHCCRRPASALLANIDGLAGPLSAGTWPHLHSLPGWVTRESMLTEARRGKDKCTDPFANPRRAMCPDGQDLAERLVRLLPQHRVEAHVAVEHTFCSRGRVRDLAVVSGGALEPAGKVSGDSTKLPLGTALGSGGAAKRVAQAAGDAPIPTSSAALESGGAPELAGQTTGVAQVALELAGKTMGDAARVTSGAAHGFGGTSGAALDSGGTLALAGPAVDVAQVALKLAGKTSGISTELTSGAALGSGDAPELVAQVAGDAPSPAPTALDSGDAPELAGQATNVGEAPQCRQAGGVALPTPGAVFVLWGKSFFSKTWKPSSLLAEPPLAADEERRCRCKGFCVRFRHKAHPQRSKGDGKCRYARNGDSLYCCWCQCAISGCSGSQSQQVTCQKTSHLFLPYPRELRAVLVLAPSLVRMEPVDLTAFLQQAPRVEHDILFLCLLADVWEPDACQALADEFVGLPTNYTARDLERCFVRAFARMNTQREVDAERESHLDVLTIGGACRHFGLRCLGKRLGLLIEKRGDADPAALQTAPQQGHGAKRATPELAPEIAPKRRSGATRAIPKLAAERRRGAAEPAARRLGATELAAPRPSTKRRKVTKGPETPVISDRLTLGKSDKDLTVCSGSSVVRELISFARQEGVKHLADMRKHAKGGKPEQVLSSIENFVFSPYIPNRMQWGRNRATYHGQHICRKLWLVEYHGQPGGQSWNLSTSFIRDMGPDKKGYLSKLPAGRLRQKLKPVDPTRLNMWCCLLGLCFNETYVPGFANAWEQGRIDVDLWDACRQKLLQEKGCTPHPVHVAGECVKTLAASGGGVAELAAEAEVLG